MASRHTARQSRSTRRRPARRGGAPVLATACALVVLTGCGAGPGDTASGDTTSSTASSPAASPSTAPGTTAPAGGASATATPSATPSPSGATSGGGSSGGTARCTTGELAVGLSDPGEGAGQRSVTLVLTNRGVGSCRIEGYGGIGLVDGSGRALPTQQVRDPAAPPQAVDLAPGASAVSRLRWTVVPGDGDATDGPCQPAPADLQVIPPDQRDPLSVGWPYGPVCSGGRIEQQAYTAGG